MRSMVKLTDSSKRFKLTCCGDHAGPLARTFLETAQLLDAICGMTLMIAAWVAKAWQH